MSLTLESLKIELGWLAFGLAAVGIAAGLVALTLAGAGVWAVAAAAVRVNAPGAKS